MDRQMLYFPCEMRAKNGEKEGNYIEGVPIVFENATDMGYYSEVIERGALSAEALSDVLLLTNHDLMSVPLARFKSNGESTMQLSVQPDGLHIRASLDTAGSPAAATFYSAVKRGDISGMSFAFKIDSEEWSDLESEHPTRRIKKISRVFEVSGVNFPAYEQTEIYARSREMAEKAKVGSDIEILKLKAKIKSIGGI